MYNVCACTLCPTSFLFFDTIAKRTYIIIKTSGQTHCIDQGLVSRPIFNYNRVLWCLCWYGKE